MQSNLRTREVKVSAELYERILEAEGMPAEFPDDERVSFVALNDEVVAASPEEIKTDTAEDGALRPRADDELSSADRDVVERIKAAGWAATPEEVGAHPDQIGRLADAGVAYLRTCGKRAVLAMSGATAADVRRAAARAECREKGTGKRPERGRSGKQESPEELTAEILRRLELRGGALEERTLEVSLRGRPPRLRRAALALLWLISTGGTRRNGSEIGCRPITT